MVFKSHQALQHVSTPKYRTRVVATTDPYRVPSERGDPLYPPLSERLPVQGLFASVLCLIQLAGADASLLGLSPNATTSLAGSIGLPMKGVRRDFVTGGAGAAGPWRSNVDSLWS